MLHHSLVNASDIALWAPQNQAADHLGMLVRRLILATVPQVKRIRMSSEEGVYAGGWDGILEATQGNAFVPGGLSVWEMGKEKNAKGKADKDYLNRTDKPGDVERTEATFIFVTPRKWRGKTDWEKDRKAAGQWRDVRAYDAEDLQAWLEIGVPVHIWLSHLLGKLPQGAEDLERFWQGWSEVTEPPTMSKILTAGRDKVVSHIHDWLSRPPSAIGLQTDTADESLALFAASVDALPMEARERVLSRAIVTEGTEAFRHLCNAATGLILIPRSAELRLVAEAVRLGHHVLMPLGLDHPRGGETLQVPRLRRMPIEQALMARGMSREQAAEAATLARRSLTAFRRRFARQASFHRPAWAQPDTARTVLPALLIEKWDESFEGDREAIARLAGEPYESYSERLSGWTAAPDSPVRRTGTVWLLTSKEDVWHLVASHLTDNDLKRFLSLAGEVLWQPSPVWDLEPDRRIMAGVIGATPRHSHFLMAGVIDTLAAIAARWGESPAPAVAGEARIYGFVAETLAKANADWRLWASLSDELPLLAEAAPDAFLDALEEGHDVVLPLFANQGNSIFCPTPHTGILWALETLAWDSDRFGRVALLLARMARLDPGEGSNQANRPMNSLRGLFLCRCPQTAAALEQRLRVMDVLREREPLVAWKLLPALFPERYGVADRSHSPKWREWAPEVILRPPPAERSRSATEATTRLLADVGSDGARWETLLDVLHSLPPSERARVTEHLLTVDTTTFPPAEVARVRHKLRRFVFHHRDFADAEWALPTPEVDRLEAAAERFTVEDPVERDVWLFDHYPPLPEARGQKGEVRDGIVASHRRDTLARVYQDGGVPLVIALAERAEAAWTIGRHLGDADILTAKDEDELLRLCVGSDEPRRREAGGAFIVAKFGVQGWPWADSLLSGCVHLSDAEGRGFFYRCLPAVRATWDRLGSEPEAVQEAYWSAWFAQHIEKPDEYEYAAEALLKFDQPLEAAHLLWSRLINQQSSAVSTTLILTVLDRAAQASIGHWKRHYSHAAHHIADLLDYLDESNDVSDDVLGQLEWRFLFLIDHRRRPNRLHRRLAREPELFIEALCLVYKPHHAERMTLTEEQVAQARQAERLLDEWRVTPGVREDASFSPEEFSDWIDRVRVKSAELDRAEAADYRIGRLLTHSPAGTDGIRPHEAVRDVIEAMHSTSMEQAFESQTINNRGGTHYDLLEGGDQERALVNRYLEDARAIGDRWPRSAALLRRIASFYESVARHQDLDAELREDLWQ